MQPGPCGPFRTGHVPLLHENPVPLFRVGGIPLFTALDGRMHGVKGEVEEERRCGMVPYKSDGLVGEAVRQVFPVRAVFKPRILVGGIIPSRRGAFGKSPDIDIKSLLFREMGFIAQMPFSGEKRFITVL